MATLEPTAAENLRVAEALRARANLRVILLAPSPTAPTRTDSVTSILARQVGGSYSYAPAAAVDNPGAVRAELPQVAIGITNSSAAPLLWQGVAVVSGAVGSELVHFFSWAGTIYNLSPGQSGTIPVGLEFGGPTADVG